MAEQEELCDGSNHDYGIFILNKKKHTNHEPDAPKENLGNTFNPLMKLNKGGYTGI